MNDTDGPTVPASRRWPADGLRCGALAVRVWRPDDVPQLVALLSDAQLRRWSPTLTVPDEQNCTDRVRKATQDEQAGRPTSFAVVDAEHPERVLGTFDFRVDHPPIFSIVDVGYGVAAVARGHGVGGAALRLMADWLLAPAGGDVERVQLDHAVENEASCRTALRAGFGIEGRRERYLPLQAAPGEPVVRHAVCLHGRVRPSGPSPARSQSTRSA